MTQEDHVELVKTHTFLRKHATGKAKIELHVLQVERGMSWDLALEKEKELSDSEQGFWLSHQVRNSKKTAILAIMAESTKTKKGKEKKDSSKLFFVYRPNTGQQVKQETLAELKKKYKKVTADECQEHWNKQFDSSAKVFSEFLLYFNEFYLQTCSHAFWKGNCKNKSIGMECEVGLRRKSYNVLTGWCCVGRCVYTLY